MLFTDQDIVRNFEARDNSRGKAYQAEGRVKEMTILSGGHRIEALVQGTERYPYRVSVDIRRKGARMAMESECTCPVGYMCKHAAAALYEAIAEETRQHERLRRHPRGKKEGTLSKATRDWLAGLVDPKEERQPSETDRIVYFLLPVRLGNLPHFSFSPALQTKMQNGDWSRPRPQSFSQLLSMNRYHCVMDEADRLLFDLLCLNANWVPPTDPELIDLALGRLIRTGRAFWGESMNRPLFLGKEETATLDWEPLPDGSQQPTLTPSCAGVEILLSRSPWHLSPDGAAGPLRVDRDAETFLHFLRLPPVGEAESAFLREQLKKTKTSVPAPYRIRHGAKKKASPLPHLRIVRLAPESGANKMEAQAFLSFSYEGQTIHPLSPAPHYQEKKDGEILLHERMKKEEEKETAKLSDFGLREIRSFDPRGLAFGPKENATPWFWMDFAYEEAEKLKAHGFEIEIDSSLNADIVEPDTDDIDASFTQNGEWWFSLDLGISIGGQRVKLLPLLVAMIRRLPSFEDVERLAQSGKCYVPLPDGRQVALDSSRIQTILKTLVELFDPKALDKNGEIRVSMDLAAAFLKLEAITRKRWLGEGHLHKLVEKLGRFEEIKSVPVPRGMKAKLRPYQIEGTNWLHFLNEYNLSGILADDMGLGKTVQALAYLQALKEKKKLDGPCLIVMPTSLVANWQTEIERFTPEMRILVLHGRERLSRFDQIEKADIVLTTYPLLSRDINILKEKKWSILILDEAQAIKNPAAKMTQAACALQASQRLCLTGTPVENHLGEAWSLFTFLMPGLLGTNKEFTKHYRAPIEKGEDPERKDLLARRLRPFVLRRLKSEVAKELPPKTEMIRRVSLAEDQRDLYEAVRHVMNDKVRDEIAAKGMARSHIVILDALLKLRQTCCDPRLVKLEAAQKVKSSAKLEELMEMLPTLIEEGRKILLFSQFTSMLDLIKPELNKAGISFVELRGSTKDRKTPIEQFQKGDVPLFLISLKAGGTGLNLTAADTVIHYDPWWNPSVENQATDRAHRIGQDKPVFVYKMIAEGTVEERILELQTKKVGLAAALFGDKPDAAAKLSPDDLQWLMG